MASTKKEPVQKNAKKQPKQKKPFVMKDGQGSLFKNDKEGNSERPDYFGKCKVDGIEHRLAAWVKTAKSGIKYISLSISDLEESNEPDETEDDLPF